MPSIQDLPHEIDVAVVGAGLSGINQAYRIQSETKRSYVILEGRHEMGGTWSLFNYPGIRSDSDMFTLGFPFRPYKSSISIADGATIKQYIEDTAREFGIDKRIHYNSLLKGASWDSQTCRWTLEVEGSGSAGTSGGAGSAPKKTLVAKFLAFTTGYYDYNEPLQTEIPGLNNFKGQIVHPQFWPKDLNYRNKKVVVIGSGATAVTLLPNMADDVEHITMLQRSPAYYVALQRNSAFTRGVRAIMPASWSHTFLRTLFAFRAYAFFYVCQWYPNAMKKLLQKGVKRLLPKGYNISPDFDPSYNPWDQRLCFVPDGDLFKSLHTGKASIVTDHIKTFTDKAVITQKGHELPADIVVTATGLKIQLFGGCKVTVDGQALKIGQKMTYRGTFLQDVPNAGLLIGYVNASWTLGSDVSALHVCKLLNQLERRGKDAAVPRVQGNVEHRPLINLKSNYLQRAEDYMPKAGTAAPWYNKSIFFKDLFAMKTETFSNSIEYLTATKK